eukprot:gnl/Hemi2/4616_TR1598_c0_g1_i1.p2 gnl/Hemi2/4616_TR1598_c0_g1~~gnl/Hemi2/4616_TR1598_c0_g1_i1.p2  ORF type:complete len:205 (+),score=37.36 gnl/Hemi2/4616_TR1598_c0_g1_i1:120-734(+)
MSTKLRGCFICMSVFRGGLDLACCNLEKIHESHYVRVYENRIESNYPCWCCCCALDCVQPVYFDRTSVFSADRAGVCLPCWTHCHLCPTCCDMCGEGTVVHGKCCCMHINRAPMPRDWCRAGCESFCLQCGLCCLCCCPGCPCCYIPCLWAGHASECFKAFGFYGFIEDANKLCEEINNARDHATKKYGLEPAIRDVANVGNMV